MRIRETSKMQMSINDMGHLLKQAESRFTVTKLEIELASWVVGLNYHPEYSLCSPVPHCLMFRAFIFPSAI